MVAVVAGSGDGRTCASLDLTRVEVAQLWWFADGAIMDRGTRLRLRRDGGLCPRHAWAYFVCDCELRWRPLGTAILYEDLLSQTLRALSRWPHSTRRLARAGSSCLTCEYVGNRASVPGFERETERANLRERSTAFVAGCAPTWGPRVCPACDVGGRGVPCRTHVERTQVTSVVDQLTHTLRRLSTCVRSMTFDGPPRRPDSDAALVETLGWFAGWQPAVRLSGQGASR